MTTLIIWYLLVSVIGWLAWPLAFGLLPGLPDRGYAFSRALGLLVVGYIFWLLNSLGLLYNTVGGIVFAILIMAGLAFWAYQRRIDQDSGLFGWLDANRGYVLTAEILFLVAFALWTLVRAYNPELTGTEKPMEIAFLNGVRASHSFPPQDPWLSGYAISYYYFGYVIVAMLADLSGTVSGVAFNMGIALLFAMTLLGSYGLVYNLIAAGHRSDTGSDEAPRGARIGALFGPLLVGVMGNLEGFLEFLRAMNPKFIPAAFWSWLDIEEISEPVTQTLGPLTEWRHWWWWRASRVIRERDAVGTAIGLQPIDEFPMFSFVLGDMHPHVLALPFSLLTLGVAFNAAAQRERLTRVQYALLALIFGGVAFMNLSDWPIMMFILAGALILRQLRERGTFQPLDLLRSVGITLVVFVLGYLAYLPWHISFSSQVGGILPNVIFATRLHQFVVMFGPFLFIIAWFLVDFAIRQHKKMDWLNGITLGVGLLVMLIAMMIVLGLAAIRLEPEARSFLLSSAGVEIISQSEENLAANLQPAIQAVLHHRLAHPLTAISLTVLLVLTIASLIPRSLDQQDTSTDPADITPAKAELHYPASTGFVLLLILTGLMLTLGPEFVYIRDNFGQRINTIFKFYYAAWLLFGIASSYAAYRLITTRPHPALKIGFAVGFTLLVVAGLFYPVLAVPTKMGWIGDLTQLPEANLDGTAYMYSRYPSDMAGIEWLRENADPDAVVAEAIGGAYSDYGRVSALTGLQTVMGWPNHERQWRGEKYSMLAGNRESDIRELYNTQSSQLAQELIDQYGVTYIFVGTLERSGNFATPAGLQKFDRFLTPVFRDGTVVIYRADQPLIEELEP